MHAVRKLADNLSNLVISSTSCDQVSSKEAGNVRLVAELQFDGVKLPQIGNGSTTLHPKDLEHNQSSNSAAVASDTVAQIRPLHYDKQSKGIFTTISDGYFKPKAFEENGTIYKALGTGYFKNALMGTIGRILTYLRDKSGEGNTYCLGGHTLKDLKEMEWATRFNESVHIGAILLTNMPSAIISLSNGQPPSWDTIVWFVINAYCIMLQRFNRERLFRAIDRTEQRPSNKIPHFNFSSCTGATAPELSHLRGDKPHIRKRVNH